MHKEDSDSLKPSPEILIVEVFKHIKGKDLEIKSISQIGRQLEVNGSVQKFNGKVKIDFRFICET